MNRGLESLNAMKKLRRKLIKTDFILIFVVVFATMSLIICGGILPHFGIEVSANIDGCSMYPVISDGSLVVGIKSPYEDLKVGDIIMFRTREEYATMDTSYIKDTTREDGIDAFTAEVPATDDASDENPNEEIHYLKHEQIIHRIIRIDDDGIYTRGDYNYTDDPFPVFEEGYVAKVIWYVDYLGIPFKILFSHKLIFWLMGIIMVLSIFLIITKPMEKTVPLEGKDDGHEN